MKLSFFTLVALMALTYAEPDRTLKTADSDFLKNQAKVLSLYVGLGSDVRSSHDYQHQPFPYNDVKYYKNPKALEGFMKSYERGLLDQDGVFTFYCHRNRHDTFHIFDILFYAKDFDTFYNIALWARKELNPLQFFYAYTTAILHREDTRGYYVPPVSDVFPHYFIQSYYMNEARAYTTYNDDYQSILFKFNNTGWENSWHSEMTGGAYPTGPRWVGDDLHARTSYFRENAAWTNSYEYWIMRFAPWLSTEKYPEIHFSHRGEVLYGFYKYLLDRYSLERLSYKLPTTYTFETDKPMPGYNSHLVDYMGRSFLVRTDGIVPVEANPDATWNADTTERRVQQAIDSGYFFFQKKEMRENRSSRDSFETFSKLIHGTRDSPSRNYYGALIYQLVEAAKDVVIAPNDRDYTTSPLGLTMTQLRDPAFYMILSNIDTWYNSMIYTLPSYTQEELKFSGVSLENVEVDKLVTYNIRRKFELTNGLPFKNEADRYNKRSFAKEYILDHEPFNYEFVVNSDKDQDAMIRVMIGPKFDGDRRAYTLNQMSKVFVPLNKYIVKLNAGKNTFKKSSFQPEFYNNYQNFYDYYAKVNKSIETNEPFEYSELNHCGTPYNLQLPRGWKSGKEYVLFVMVTPYSEEHIDKEGYYQCLHNIYMDQYSTRYPFDRYIRFPNTFMQDNMYFKDVMIYHYYAKPPQ